MMKNELEIINLNKQFKDVKALNNINYTFHNGIYGLLGPNGAGKSTLINAITDNIKRDSGSILWNGNEILRLGKKYRNELGYMPQQQGYYGEFTAYAFMMYLAGLKGLDKKEAKARTEELLNEVNMYEFRNKTLENKNLQCTNSNTIYARNRTIYAGRVFCINNYVRIQATGQI